MDKRSIIAIVLTILVLLAWQLFVIAPKQKEAARRRAKQLRERALVDSINALREDSLEAVRQVSPAVDTTVTPPEREEVATEWDRTFPGRGGEQIEDVHITVVTEMVKIVLGNRGGEVKSIELLEFHRKDGGLVELVPQGAAGGLALSFIENDERRALSDRQFDVRIDGRPVVAHEEIVLGTQRERVEVLFTMEGAEGGLIQKRYTVHREGYEIGLDVTIRREGELRNTDAYDLSWECGMAATEKDEKGDKRQFASLGRVGDEFYKESMSKFGKEQEKPHEGMVVWAGARTKYFLSALLPVRRRAGRLSMLGSRDEDHIGYALGYSFRGDPRLVEDSFSCYLGPLDMNTLKAYDVGLEKTIDLGKLRFLSVFVLKFMMVLRRFIPNYGLIIIILSILTKILFYRLTHKSFKSMKDMQRLQPKIKELQEKYKDSREKMNQEMMKLYKEAGVNPLGGCLPLLLQLPVFIALFNVLRNTIELRGAPFVFWINDLSSPDVLFGFGTKLPFLGSEFHLLPILMGAAMVLQSKLGGSPTGQAGPAAQTRMMSTMMPIVFTFLFYGMPSGLVLYWLVNNIFSIIQQYYVHREIEAEDREELESGQAVASEQRQEPSDEGADSRKAPRRARSGKGGRGKSRKGKRRTYH
ncbi:MAG: membrane protein insertase YidC [bacterium]|nr:MAG: membrane protein insertase YidC [bacterium]